MTPARLSVIVVSYNTRDLTRDCLAAALEATRQLAVETWLVDNASSDGTTTMVRAEFPDVNLIENRENAGYGTATNQAMRRANGRTFLILNSDVTVTRSAVAAMASALEAHPAVAVVGAGLVGRDGRPRPSARRFPRLVSEFLLRFRIRRLLPKSWRSRLLLAHDALPHHARRPDWVTGACLLVRRDAFEQVGGFDESIFLYGEELEWCARLRRAGWEIACVPEAEVVHVGRASSGHLLEPRRLALSLEGDLRYLSRYRSQATLAAFALVRAAGLAFEGLIAAARLDAASVRSAAYQLRTHWRLTLRYLAAPAPAQVSQRTTYAR